VSFLVTRKQIRTLIIKYSKYIFNCNGNIAFYLGEIAILKIFFTVFGMRVLIFKRNLLSEGLIRKSLLQKDCAGFFPCGFKELLVVMLCGV
jgi:hypothetical protein